MRVGEPAWLSSLLNSLMARRKAMMAGRDRRANGGSEATVGPYDITFRDRDGRRGQLLSPLLGRLNDRLPSRSFVLACGGALHLERGSGSVGTAATTDTGGCGRGR